MSFRDRGGRYGDSRYQREGMSGTTGGWNSGTPSQMYPDPSVAPPYGGPMPPGPQNFGPGPPGMMPPPMPVGGPMPGGPGPQQMPGFQLGESRGPLGSYGNMQGNLPYPPMGGPGYNNQGPGFNPQQQGAPGFNQFPLNEQPGGPPFHQPPVNYGPDFGRCGDEFQREFGPDGRFGPAMRNDRPHSDSDGRDRGPEDGYYRNRQGGRFQDNLWIIKDLDEQGLAEKDKVVGQIEGWTLMKKGKGAEDWDQLLIDVKIEEIGEQVLCNIVVEVLRLEEETQAGREAGEITGDWCS
ncbi:cleavage and polyadenylation specificity factor subunit 6-like [Lingula anatina]|uniref:Cleavage and polyadenylation specificity factor subunit 6-like n=1 Tax=Lingula anatina TaxID=7574 RepID=A0A2R2MKF3_LINAN|nr:cleavage and polyadenylation specificity factor subunit 6-like [Lingula anatina]|eukprot:XP_023930547.1 cleavage and polyadenylation specificity factor subunit 6-like [Lingula anatina]